MGILTDKELSHFEDSITRFVANQYTWERRLVFAASADGLSREMWLEYADLGWLGLSVPEEFGGAGGGASELGALVCAAGRGLLLEPLLAAATIGTRLIAKSGADEQARILLPLLATGELLIAFAHAEPRSGHQRHMIDTRACTDAGIYRINGHKRCILHGAAADRLIVSARTDQGELGLFLVDGSAPGLHRSNYRLVDDRCAADMTLENVPVERLGSGDMTSIVDEVLDYAVAVLCGETMGIVSQLTRLTLEYVKTRQQFGRSIGTFQVIQHRLVDMTMAEQESWAVTRCAQRAIDAELADAWRIVSAAKVRVDRTARYVCEQSVQLYGGIGMSDELIVGHYLKRVMVNATLLGDIDWHLDRLGAEL